MRSLESAKESVSVAPALCRCRARTFRTKETSHEDTVMPCVHMNEEEFCVRNRKTQGEHTWGEQRLCTTTPARATSSCASARLPQLPSSQSASRARCAGEEVTTL